MSSLEGYLKWFILRGTEDYPKWLSSLGSRTTETERFLLSIILLWCKFRGSKAPGQTLEAHKVSIKVDFGVFGTEDVGTIYSSCKRLLPVLTLQNGLPFDATSWRLPVVEISCFSLRKLIESCFHCFSSKAPVEHRHTHIDVIIKISLHICLYPTLGSRTRMTGWWCT